MPLTSPASVLLGSWSRGSEFREYEHCTRSLCCEIGKVGCLPKHRKQKVESQWTCLRKVVRDPQGRNAIRGRARSLVSRSKCDKVRLRESMKREDEVIGTKRIPETFRRVHLKSCIMGVLSLLG